MGIILLSEVVKIWLDSTLCESVVYFKIIQSEICYLGRSGSLSHMFVTNINLAIDSIINYIITSDSALAEEVFRILDIQININSGKDATFMDGYGDLIFAQLLSTNLYDASKINMFTSFSKLMEFHDNKITKLASLEEGPELLYFIFQSNAIQQIKEDENMFQNLKNILLNIAARINIPLSGNPIEKGLLKIKTLENLLLCFIMDLGSDTADSKIILKGSMKHAFILFFINVFC